MVYFLLSINTKCYKERRDYWIEVLVLIKSKVAHYSASKIYLKKQTFYQNILLDQQKFNKPIRLTRLTIKEKFNFRSTESVSR